MTRLSIGIYLCYNLALLSTLRPIEGKLGSGKCSCYSFVNQPQSRHASQNQCEDKNGALVSMETLEEWEFVNTQIQNKTTEDGRNEWWIGLERRKDGNWTWFRNHSLTYGKWLKGNPTVQGDDYVTIARDENGTQGLFIQLNDTNHRGRICEFPETNETRCRENGTRWCTTFRMMAGTLSPSTPNITDIHLPRQPHECIVKVEKETPVIIPVIVALAGLLVIVAVNIVIAKRKCASKESHRKMDIRPRYSGSLAMDDEANAIAMNIPETRLDQNEENIPPSQEYVCRLAKHPKYITNEVIDVRGTNTVKADEQPYYMNIQSINCESIPQNTLPVLDTDHYASVSDIMGTEGQKDTFGIVSTYSTVHSNVGQTDESMSINYATVNDTFDTVRKINAIEATESGYASVDVINNDCQRGASVSGHKLDFKNDAEEPIQYAVIDIKKKRSKKIKTKPPDNQDSQDSSEDVINNDYQRGASVSGHKLDCKTVAEEPIQYAVIDIKKKRSKKIKTKPPDNHDSQDASEDVINNDYQRSTSVSGHKLDCKSVAEEPTLKKKKSKKLKIKEPDKQNSQQFAHGQSVDVVNNTFQRIPSVSGYEGEQNAKDNTTSHAEELIPYAVIDISKKKSKKLKTKRPDNENNSDIGYSAEVIYGNCQNVPPFQADHEEVDGYQQNTQQPLDDMVPNAEAQVRYAAVNKSMKERKRSVKLAETTNKSTEASYTSINVLYGNCQSLPRDDNKLKE